MFGLGGLNRERYLCLTVELLNSYQVAKVEGNYYTPRATFAISAPASALQLELFDIDSKYWPLQSSSVSFVDFLKT